MDNLSERAAEYLPRILFGADAVSGGSDEGAVQTVSVDPVSMPGMVAG